MAGKPFDPTKIIPWALLTAINPASLRGRVAHVLGENRLEKQREFRRLGFLPNAVMAVTPNGVVLEGHHRCRVAWELGESVDMLVTDAEEEPGLPIPDLPVVEVT